MTALGGAGPQVVVLDAGPSVGFAAAGKLPLLNKVFDEIGLRRVVPAIVDQEVRRQDPKHPGTRKNWVACVSSGRIEVLPEVTATSGDPGVRDKVAELRDVDVEEAFATKRDLGEILVVAHAILLRESGHDVAVSIDDSDGARRAALHQFVNLDTVEILSLAIDLDVITSKQELRSVYKALGAVSSLPDLSTTGLLDRF